MPHDALPAAQPPVSTAGRQRIAVVGAGISGLSCAWRLATRHDVTVFEAEARPGGHSHTVAVALGDSALDIPVDTGFIVYNEPAYPNLTALFAHLQVPTDASDMSFAVSLRRGELEYAGTDLRGLFAQKRNLLRPRFWSMLHELLRFYREAPRDAHASGEQTLDEYLDAHGYGRAFRDDHLYPMAAAIWSSPAAQVGRHPVSTFVRFCENHGLLQVADRPVWRTVRGGSREYVRRLRDDTPARWQLDTPVLQVRREAEGVRLRTREGWWPEAFDQVVLATHADRSLDLLDEPTPDERRLLSAFPYGRNLAVLHTDPALMPRRRAAWCSWNYLAPHGAESPPMVTYWMNRLQPHLPQGEEATPLFVTLNPTEPPAARHLLRTEVYEHPIFDAASVEAQRRLWRLQGARRTWFCGAWFGSGFHEDGLQSGLAVAEALGGGRRPWTVANESGRIHLGPVAAAGQQVRA